MSSLTEEIDKKIEDYIQKRDKGNSGYTYKEGKIVFKS
jgi:hypothetical protein